MREDWLLIRRLRRGDKVALRHVYEKYRDDMLTAAVWLVVDIAAAEDCVHDAFVGLAGRPGELCLQSGLKGYLVTCVANRARDQLRRKSRQDVSLSDIADIAADPADPETELMKREEARRLYAALAELPYEQREVVALHLHGQLKFREVAKHQGVSIKTVQSRYRYGLDKLRTLLKEGTEHEAHG